MSRDLRPSKLNLTDDCIIANIQVTYQCVYTTRPEYLLRICEGLSRTVRCYWGKKINIIEANYGRLTGGQICPGKIKTTYCGAARSQAKVRTACQGKSQCVLQAKNSIYGDPCRGTTKYVEVSIIQFKLFLLDSCLLLSISLSQVPFPFSAPESLIHSPSSLFKTAYSWVSRDVNDLKLKHKLRDTFTRHVS